MVVARLPLLPDAALARGRSAPSPARPSRVVVEFFAVSLHAETAELRERLRTSERLQEALAVTIADDMVDGHPVREETRVAYVDIRKHVRRLHTDLIAIIFRTP